MSKKKSNPYPDVEHPGQISLEFDKYKSIANQFMEARQWYALVLESEQEGDKEIVSYIQYQIDLLLRQNYVTHKIFNNEKQG